MQIFYLSYLLSSYQRKVFLFEVRAVKAHYYIYMVPFKIQNAQNDIYFYNIFIYIHDYDNVITQYPKPNNYLYFFYLYLLPNRVIIPLMEAHLFYSMNNEALSFLYHH